jgi:hypothetical protein
MPLKLHEFDNWTLIRYNQMSKVAKDGVWEWKVGQVEQHGGSLLSWFMDKLWMEISGPYVTCSQAPC